MGSYISKEVTKKWKLYPFVRSSYTRDGNQKGNNDNEKLSQCKGQCLLLDEQE